VSSDRKKWNLDTALREWPHVEKPSVEWDDRARSVMERLRRGERGATASYVSDDDLLADPLGPRADDERANREADRLSLRELAKMARSATPPPPTVMSAPELSKERVGEAKGEDSGLIHLAATAAAAATSNEIADAKREASPAPIAPERRERPEQVEARPASNVVALADKKKKKSALGLLVGSVFALSAVAAGTFLFLQLTRQPVTVATMTQPTAGAVHTTQAPVVPPSATGETAIDPNALPSAPTVAAAPKTSVQPSGTIALARKDEPKDPPAKIAEKDLPKTPTGPNAALGDEMRKSVGASASSEIDVKPAAAPSGQNSVSGNVPTKPSQGAVTGAIGAVLPAARECLGPDDPISRAQIVFSSDGTVQSVTVSGPAAGKPTEACIKGALSKAKVPPFAEPSYTAPITIRHR
jgi:hypothetical protein